MTKYEELWTLFIEGEKRFARYREESWNFAAHIVDTLIDLLDCPRQQLQIFPVDQGPESEQGYAIPDALNYDGDGYWSMAIFLSIKDPKSYSPGTITLAPEAGFLIRLSFCQQGEHFRLRLGNNKYLDIDPSSHDDVKSYLLTLIEEIKRILDSDFGLHNKANPVRRLGFDV